MLKRASKLFKLLFWVLVLGPIELSIANTPNIVVTIKPIHSIVSNLTKGITEPSLLLPDGVSPHTYQIKPSHRKILQDADLIFWVGESYETHMTKVMQQFPERAIRLIGTPKLNLLHNRAVREFVLMDAPSKAKHHDHDHEEEQHQHHNHGLNHGHALDETDPHIWLSVDNAIRLTHHISKKLILANPEHQELYLKNTAHYLQRLQQLKTNLHSIFNAQKPLPYLVFHDAYQYFEKEFGLHSMGTILLNPHVPLSPKALREIQLLLSKHNIQCIYYEPEFSQQPLKPLLAQSGVTVLELDPLGARQKQGNTCYEDTMLQLASQLLTCHKAEKASKA
jgi:zinc transport system substrate-binding protein